ncbi:MAG: hypothetical protein M1829_001552 [Trizodia sp. TS-e1964]|nr:MAG: hypothetical protein M1829_001552 [Trizodia sp. TS-e1964]
MNLFNKPKKQKPTSKKSKTFKTADSDVSYPLPSSAPGLPGPLPQQPYVVSPVPQLQPNSSYSARAAHPELYIRNTPVTLAGQHQGSPLGSPVALTPAPNYGSEPDDTHWQNLALDGSFSSELSELLSLKLDELITSMDGERFNGGEKELSTISFPAHLPALTMDSVIEEYAPVPLIRGGGNISTRQQVSRGANDIISTAITSTNYFSKANLYSNSRLPPNLPPLQVYITTYPLLCLAAQYSQRVYSQPTGAEKETHVDADWRMGTKAMVIKSVPIDTQNTVIFAIRGSQTFMDWAVNIDNAPVSPNGFLDDPGNLCHSGFLSVARKMVKPVAARLRNMLQEDPERSKCSLLITGHSAGGAVASLLYSHMISQDIESELTILTGFFRRVHCITFGSPPVTLLPLQKPRSPALQKSLFFSFINEGDPVPRADKAYVKSLLTLYALPAPQSPVLPRVAQYGGYNISKLFSGKIYSAGIGLKGPKGSGYSFSASQPNPSIRNTASSRRWKVPHSTLSNAGRVVIMRASAQRRPNNAAQHDIQACISTDEELRSVIFGDPLMHAMKLYAQRIEMLATNAVLARGLE